MACGGVPLTLRARAVAWLPLEPIQVCGVAGSSPWLVGLPPAVARVARFLVPVVRVGRGWPTPIHGSGKRGRHDFGDLAKGCALGGGLRRARESRAPSFVLPKRVWTVSTLTSALLEGCEGVSPDARLGP